MELNSQTGTGHLTLSFGLFGRCLMLTNVTLKNYFNTKNVTVARTFICVLSVGSILRKYVCGGLGDGWEGEYSCLPDCSFFNYKKIRPSFLSPHVHT